MRNIFSRLALLLVVVACSPVAKQDDSPEPIAAFRLGHVAVVAPNLLQGPVSREATPEEWITALKPAVKTQLGQIEGDQFYHIGINVAGYALAPPGIPLVASPKSLLILDVTVIDDASRKQLNETPQQIVVGEGLSAETMISSGLVRTKEEQIEVLAQRAAGAIESWLREEQKSQGWFARRPEDEDSETAESHADTGVHPETLSSDPATPDDSTDAEVSVTDDTGVDDLAGDTGVSGSDGEDLNPDAEQVEQD